MSVKEIKAEELRLKRGEEGIVFQGCGGDVKDWVDGVNQLLKDEKILLDGTKLTECYRFENGGLTNLYFPFGNAELDMDKLAIWRIKARPVFGCMWLSDYVDNHLGGFIKYDRNQDEEALARKVYDTVYVPKFLSDEFRVGQTPVCFDEFLNNDWEDEECRQYYLDLFEKEKQVAEQTQA